MSTQYRMIIAKAVEFLDDDFPLSFWAGSQLHLVESLRGQLLVQPWGRLRGEIRSHTSIFGRESIVGHLALCCDGVLRYVSSSTLADALRSAQTVRGRVHFLARLPERVRATEARLVQAELALAAVGDPNRLLHRRACVARRRRVALCARDRLNELAPPLRLCWRLLRVDASNESGEHTRLLHSIVVKHRPPVLRVGNEHTRVLAGPPSIPCHDAHAYLELHH
mmetsp:Transcript_40100/g.110399  ORF Transcript_40100/g.110399 Transcript_40100/m.110399 type:complete len:223 (+) Transcript_40100:634-1302(+)